MVKGEPEASQHTLANEELVTKRSHCNAHHNGAWWNSVTLPRPKGGSTQGQQSTPKPWRSPLYSTSRALFAQTEHCLKGPLRHLNSGITLSVMHRMVFITTSRGTDDVQLTSNMISSVLKASRSI